MHNPIKRYREDPFFRSTLNVIGVQIVFGFITLMVFAAAIQYQQQETLRIIDLRRSAVMTGAVLTPESLNIQLYNLRDTLLSSSFLALVVLVSIFGYFSARYALQPTRMGLQYQKRFIGNIAHELRTPLSIIRTNTEVSLMDPSVDKDTRETLQLTLEELTRISGIINNLLSFDALLRPGNIRFSPVDVREVAEQVLIRHMHMAKSYGITLGLDVAEEAPSLVYGNSIALEQALTNLVKNALNYTPQHDGRSVVIRIDEKDGHVGISVIDTGIGIAQKDLYNVFQPFFRGETSRERGIGSGTSGLGLAIVNDIVRAHQGSTTIRSALNRGTTIELLIPKADVPEPAPKTALDEDDEEHEERI